MLYLAIKAMTAMKLSKDDNQPAEIVDRLFLGSVGAAFNKDSLTRNGITHILTCADNIQPRFQSVSKFLLLNFDLIIYSCFVGLQIYVAAYT